LILPAGWLFISVREFQLWYWLCCWEKRVGLNHGPIRPHNLPFAVLGGALLWFGWFGFNAAVPLPLMA